MSAVPEDERLTWFMTLMNACGSRGAECSDDKGEWVSVFCADIEPTDTFNRASDLGLISISHDNRFDTSHCQITNAGKAWVAARPSVPPVPNAREEAFKSVVASLAAAISLLERGGKNAAPSNSMFDLMLRDYRKSLLNARSLLAAERQRLRAETEASR